MASILKSSIVAAVCSAPSKGLSSRAANAITAARPAAARLGAPRAAAMTHRPYTASRTSVISMAGKEVHSAAEGVKLFNGPVSSAARDSTAFGSERPGMKAEWDAPGAIPDSAVAEWVEHMKGQGISQAMSLLSPEELGFYASPLADQYGAAFNAYEIVNMKEAGAHEKAMAFLSAADAKGEKVVLHCAGGQGRTGIILASWLVQKYGLSPEAAVAEMMEHAKNNDVSRADITAKLPGFIEKGSQ